MFESLKKIRDTMNPNYKFGKDLKKRVLAKKLAEEHTERLSQDEQKAIAYSKFSNIHMRKDAENTLSYDQLLNPEDDSASEVTTSGHESKNRVVTHSNSEGNDMSWRNNFKDIRFYIFMYRKLPESEFRSLPRMLKDKDLIISKSAQKGDRWDWAIKDNDKYHEYKALERQLDKLEKQHLVFAKSFDGPAESDSRRDYRKMNGHYTKQDAYAIYKDFRKELQKMSFFEKYARQIEILGEITYSALKRQIAMANDKETKDPHNLYKNLNRNFKKSYTEDFFREPVAACVEVLEYISAWIAEKLSLPPPDPVDHDVVIYKREDKFNYSYLGSVIKNKKAQLLVSRGVPFNDTESFGYMFLNQ